MCAPSNPVVADVAETILDTNVVMDLWLFADARVAPLAQALAQGAVRWVRTPPMRAELEHVLAHHPVVAAWAARQGRHPDDLRTDVLARGDELAFGVAVEAASTVAPLCRDASDQVFVDLAWSRRCTWLVSRDRALLALRRRLASVGVQVVATWPGADENPFTVRSPTAR